MKRLFVTGLFFATAFSANARLLDLDGSIAGNFLVNGDKTKWVSECKMRMKGELQFNGEKNVDMTLHLFTSSDCSEDSRYITFRSKSEIRRGEEKLTTDTYNDHMGYDSEGREIIKTRSYTWQSRPAGFEIKPGPIYYDHEESTAGITKSGELLYDKIALKMIKLYAPCLEKKVENIDRKACLLRLRDNDAPIFVKDYRVQFLTPSNMIIKIDDTSVHFDAVTK